MSDLSDLLKTIPVGDIAKQLGISDESAQSAIEQVVPTLLGGMQANATSGGEASLVQALAGHADKAAGAVSLDTVDTADGEKIVQHVLGEHSSTVAATLADNNKAGEVTQGIISKVLPIVAPIVMAWLAKKFLGGGSTSTASTASASSEGGLGSILGSVLGGGSSSSSGGLGGLLGGLLGGGTSSSSGGSSSGDLLGGILGGLLGGGTK